MSDKVFRVLIVAVCLLAVSIPRYKIAYSVPAPAARVRTTVLPIVLNLLQL